MSQGFSSKYINRDVLWNKHPQHISEYYMTVYLGELGCMWFHKFCNSLNFSPKRRLWVINCTRKIIKYWISKAVWGGTVQPGGQLAWLQIKWSGLSPSWGHCVVYLCSWSSRVRSKLKFLYFWHFIRQKPEMGSTLMCKCHNHPGIHFIPQQIFCLIKNANSTSTLTSS